MIEITFNNKKSFSDLNITIDSFSIQPPSKKKIKETVPFMNGSYDFSTLGSNGEILYDERSIKIKFNLNQKNRGSLFSKYSEVLSWLMESGKSQLIFSDMSDCYYLAEVENAPSFETIFKRSGIMEVDFVAYPFKTGLNYEGSDIWDTFNFDIDIVQDIEFDVIGSKTVTIQNVGRVVVPTVNCSSSMTCTLNGYTANFVSGDNKDYDFKLQSGSNSISITGTGHVKFLFKKVML